MAAPNIFNIAPGRPFLDVLARAILDGDLPAAGSGKPDILDLPAITILLPTRRSARALQAAFLRAGRGRAMLLPSIRPIAEGDEERGLIESLAAGDGSALAGIDLPPAVADLERLIVLTNLVMAWSRAMRASPDADGELMPVPAAGAANAAQAAHLAGELARLMDAVETENVALDRLAGLVPERFSEHWRSTLQFLRIATEYWPAHLRERGLMAPAERRNQLILAEARRLSSAPPQAPVIVAGVTGSIPATAELMRAVLRLPNGAIVLPGLDRDLDAASWERILAERRSEHPQFGFRMLLERLSIAREEVSELSPAHLAPGKLVRNRLVSEALRPTGSMEHWRTFIASANRDALASALSGVSLIEAPTTEDEAEAIALILREAAERPGVTAALVSPDRLLARRVAVRLASWGIRVDDSAGRPFAKTMPGTLLDLVASVWESDFAPPELMALLKHPLTRLGLAPGPMRRAARHLELCAFRTTYLGSGLPGVARAVDAAARAAGPREQPNHAAQSLRAEDFVAVRDLVGRLTEAFAPLSELTDAEGARPLRELARRHAEVAERIAAPPPAAGDAAAASGDAGDRQASPLWTGEAGELGWQLFERLADPSAATLDLAPAEYPDFYRSLVASETVRQRTAVHPRLAIWGPLEARLQQPDILILGSLNEGTWPKAVEPGAWLSRPMRAELGLPAPEEETGRAAHDFACLLGADRVIMTRANKVDGVPRVPSRWLLRLKALLGGLGLSEALSDQTPWLGYARWRTRTGTPEPCGPPAPRPALVLRPRRASVSDIETWIANPYALFAKRILRLLPMPPLGQDPGPREKGQLVHASLSAFAQRHPRQLPADIGAAFMTEVRAAIGAFADQPRVKAFWLPRLERFADWFAATEAERRRGVAKVLAEVAGSLVIAAPGGPFTLTARADRIDASPSGLVITDYKTGRIPSHKEVQRGIAPQLPLEAAIALAGGFAGVPAAAIAGLRYIRATGGEPPGEEKAVDTGKQDAAALATSVLGDVTRLIADFDDPSVPYLAVRRAGFTYEYDAYAHLARVAEWSIDAGDSDA